MEHIQKSANWLITIAATGVAGVLTQTGALIWLLAVMSTQQAQMKEMVVDHEVRARAVELAVRQLQHP